MGCRSSRICLNKKCRERRACENRCCSYFGADLRWLNSCKAACIEYGEAIQSACDYLLLTDSEDEYIASTGLDPCAGGVSIEDLAAPWQQIGQDQAKAQAEGGKQAIRTLGIAAGALLLILLFIIYMRK